MLYYMSSPALRAAATALLVLPACTDLATKPQRVPSKLEISESVVTISEGQPVSLDVTVLDQFGRPIAVPSWAAPVWSTSDPRIATASGSALTAVGPGHTTASVSVAGLSGSATLRVNPQTITLSVDTVEVWQGGGRAEVLSTGQSATVRIYLRANKPNFFRPVVRVNVRRNGAVIETLDATTASDSIPQTANRSVFWAVNLSGDAVQPGSSLEILPDPSRTLPHGAGSQQRYPVAGDLPLRFALRVMIRGVYLNQGVQRGDGSVPLAAGRDALLRAFVVSDADISSRPVVRATLYRNGAAVRSFDMQRAAPSFPREVDEGSIESSWNVRIQGALLTPGTSLVVEADPQRTIPLDPASTARYPTSGQRTLDVRDVPPLWVRMIPVHQTAFGTTGNINPNNLAQYTTALIEKFPIAESNIDIRGVYTTNSRLDSYTGWTQLLREMDALRTADGSRRYYYGVVTHPGGQGTPGGIGYVGWPAAVGYDRMPYGPETFAHELGHNFNLPHAPCGNPTGVDPQFPYSTGGIGVWGYDLFRSVLKDPSREKDLMSYCAPEWISDYNYEKVLAFRERRDRTTTGPDQAVAREPALLVWGGTQAGQMVLEPAFEIEMPAQLPDEQGGAYRVEGFDLNGTRLFSYRFNPRVVDHQEQSKSFAFSIPSRIAQTHRLERLAVTGPEGTASRSRAADPAGPQLSAQSRGTELALSWQGASYQMALIRDIQTGEVLSFARGGQAHIRGAGPNVDVILSDGVRSVRQSVRRIP